MSDQLLVGTRKGLFTLQRDSGGWAIHSTNFVGDPVNIVLRDERDGALYAALPLGHYGVKLRRSDDRGVNWHECAVPQYARNADDDEGPSLDEIWSLTGAGSDQPGSLWCGTIPGGLFRSSDRPFGPELAGTLDILRAIFAEQLSQLIRVHHRAKPEWPDDAQDYEEFGEDDFGFGLAA